MIVCPGCGARNEPSARVCDWCARPFVAERQQLSVPWLAPVAVGAIGVLAAGTIVIALVGARANAGVANAPLVTPEPIRVEVALPWEQEPDPTASPQPPTAAEEFVRITNTGGTGAFLRREPRAGAPGILAHRDGTVLRVVGPDVQADGRAWRQVEDRLGNRGWTPREFLTPSDVGF